MKNTHSLTKKSLLFSILSMLVCMVMFVGITYAWFSADVTNHGNKIVAGSLEVELWYTADEEIDYENINEESAPIFELDNFAPGDEVYAYFMIKNTGTIDIFVDVSFQSEDELVYEFTKGMEDLVLVTVDEGDELTLADLWQGNESLFQASIAAGQSALFTVKIAYSTIATEQGGVIPNFDILVSAIQQAEKDAE